MTTLREFCRATGAAFHVAGVERYAAPLVRAGLLPRSREEASEQDAALLLLAMVAAARPGDAVEVVERLSRLPFLVFKRYFDDPSSFPVEEWVQIELPEKLIASLAVAEAVKNEIKSAAEGEADGYVQTVEIAEGGGEVRISGRARWGDSI